MNLQEARKLNRMIIASPSSKPHEKDLARMRLNILKGKGKVNDKKR